MYQVSEQSIITHTNQYCRFPIEEIKVREAIQSNYLKNYDGIISSSRSKENQLYIESNQRNHKKYITQFKGFKRLQQLNRATESVYCQKINNIEYLFTNTYQNKIYRVVVFAQVRGYWRKVKTFAQYFENSIQKMLFNRDEVILNPKNKTYIWKFIKNSYQVFNTKGLTDIAYLPQQEQYLLAISRFIGSLNFYLTCFKSLKKSLDSQQYELYPLLEEEKAIKGLIEFESLSNNKLVTNYTNLDRHYSGYYEDNSSGDIYKERQIWEINEKQVKFIEESSELVGEFADYEEYSAYYYSDKNIEYFFDNQASEGEKRIKYNSERIYLN